MSMGAFLRIYVLADTAEFLNEIGGVLAATKYARHGAPTDPAHHVHRCVILDGRTNHAALPTDLRRGDSIIMVGGTEVRGVPDSQVVRLARPLAPEVLEGMLDQISRLAWTLAGKSERRMHERYSCPRSIADDIEILDLSEGGCQLETLHPLPSGHTFHLSLKEFIPQLEEPLGFSVVALRPAPRPGRYRIHGFFQGESHHTRSVLQEALARLSVTV